MITRADIVERANAWGLSEAVVEKDYVIGWLLWGIGAHPALSRYWAFKGGTCLKKCFFETYRFSEDLDFSVLPGSPFQDADQVFDLTPVEQALREVIARVEEASGLDMTMREPLLRPRNNGRVVEGRVYYLGPAGSSKVAKLKLDISGTEVVVRPTVSIPIRHGFPDSLPGPATVRAYCFEELFAEKIRAMGERGRPRDLYDIVNIYRHSGLGRSPEEIRAVLTEKCSSKGIPVPTAASVLGASTFAELESEWENMLGHQLPTLPPLQTYLDEVESLFLWLSGELETQELPVARLAGAIDHSWSPPQYATTWGGAPIERIRFAAANLLLIDLRYKGGWRIVEPYSLRRSRDGNLLLYARRTTEDQIKAYRIDRVEGVRVRRDTFEPRYRVEFTPGGSIEARPTREPVPVPLTARRRTAFTRGPQYTVRCPLCEKTFKRKRPSTKLNKHKNREGYACPGQNGNLV